MKYWKQLIEQLQEYEGHVLAHKYRPLRKTIKKYDEHVFAQKYRILRKTMINTIGIHRYASGMCEVCGKLIQIDILKDAMSMRDTSLEKRSIKDLLWILEEVLSHRKSYMDVTIMADWSLFCEDSHIDRSMTSQITTQEDPPIDGIPF